MNISRSGMVTFLAVLGVLAGVTAAHAAAGGLDQTFGSGGIVTTSYNGPSGDRGEFGGVGTFRADHRWLRWLAIIALVAAGCGGSGGPKTASGGAPATADGATAGASVNGSVKLPATGCGLLSDVVVTALLGGSPTSSSELRPPGASPGSVVGCTWRGAGVRQAGVIVHQGPGSARDFADNTSDPTFQPVPGLGDKAMLHVAAGGEEGSIWVLKGDVDILVFGTLSGSADGYAATLKQAAAAILTHLGPG